MRLFVNITSTLFHPLLMVTYGVALALGYTYLALYPPVAKIYLLGGVFISTAVAPGLLILLLFKSGAASDLELTNRRERVIPYLIFIASNMLCLFYMYKMQVPFWLQALVVGVCIALLFALFINFFWKISAHAIGIGGLLGAMMGVCRIHLLNPYWAFIMVIVIAGLIGTARIILRKHTPMQIYAGFSLGFLCTYIACLWNYLYLFIK
ncbi:MAG: hypothetical protein LUG96_13445 [Tannerellaceae bacterium]|nr:hypothetical protein [Tannerellaceae bacterium]